MSTVTLQFRTVPLVRTPRRGRRLGTAVLLNPKTMIWKLVPTYQYGLGTHYEWNEAVSDDYPTKRAALEARKALRAAGKLP